MTLNEAIKHCEEVAERQRSDAHVHEDMMVFNQSIKHGIEAEYHEELMNECLECAKEHRQLAEWLRELKERKSKCKWIRYDYRTICPENHDIDNPYWRIPENTECLKYCPYCGKEIEVTE